MSPCHPVTVSQHELFMNLDVQNILALGVVAMAAAYLGRLGWRTLSARKAAGCGTCGSCPSTKSSEPGAVVSVDQLVDSARPKN